MFKKFEKIFDITPHPFAVFSAEGKLLYQNVIFETFEEVLIDEKSILRSEFLSIIAFFVRGKFDPGAINIKANQKYYELTYYKDDSDNSIILHGTDISREKSITENLESTSNHLEILINNSEHGLLMEDESRRIVFTNQNFCDLFNIPSTPEHMIGADCSESAEQSKGFFKNSNLFVSRITELLHDKRRVEKEILETVTNKTLERNYYPIFINNKYRGHLWTYKDISNEINLKKGIEVQRNFFESILHNIPADIAVFDKKHTYLFVNKNGIKNPEIRKWIIGKRDEDYAILKNKPEVLVQVRRKHFNEAIHSKKISSWEDEIKISETESHYILRNFYPMLNSNGKIELVIGYGIDITNRKKVEKQIIANFEHEKQLTETKSNFLTTVSHEIRTPLSVISLSAEAIKMYCESLPAQLKLKFEGKLFQIESEIDRLTNIISDVINIEKIESNAFLLNKNQIDFKEFIKNLVKRQSKIQNDGRIAALNISGKPLPMYADKIKLTIAIDNILSNAFKYSSKMPAPKVNVKFNQLNLQLKIIDSGIGIPETHIPKLFKIFERAGNVLHIRGTGLGLFLVKQIIDLHNGSIDYTHNPEGGSIFTISLPYN